MNIVIRTSWNGTPAPKEEWIRLTVEYHACGIQILLDAPFYGDPAPGRDPGPTPQLWEYEVVEVFVLHADPTGRLRYTEIELGPHGHHLVLRLDGVRQVVSQLHPIQYVVEMMDGGIARSEGAGPTRWRGEAQVPWALLPPKPWRFNATAIHGSGVQRRYLSWTPLPGDAPDFHRLGDWPMLDLR